MKVAIVHEWLATYAGSERVLQQLLILYPDADLFALVDFLEPEERGFLGGRKVRTSFLQRLPFGKKLFRQFLFLMPFAVEQFDLSGYDLVISSSHAVAKGVLTGPDQLHVSYVYSPMRYAWDMQHQYLRQSGIEKGLKGLYARYLLHRMRIWDLRTANGVDLFITLSNYIARRIWKAYRRESVIVPPPVDLESFQIGHTKSRSYLVASRMVPYKRIDLVVQAFAKMPGRELIVAGDGPERKRIEQCAAGAPNISLLGKVPHAELVRLMQEARAFVFAAEEDFGIAVVEAQACGTPVLAFCRGGAADIVSTDPNAPSGILFEEQTIEGIIDAVERFEASEAQFTPENCRINAERFSEESFRARFAEAVENLLQTA